MVITCGNCGVRVDAQQVQSGVAGVFSSYARVAEMGACGRRARAVYPPAPAAAPVKNLPPDVDGAWREARSTFAVAAYTASEMMRRKILMHLAVDVTGAAPGRQFVEYVDELDAAGHITPGPKPVINRLRRRGNFANHELPASLEADALATLTVTEYLLRGIYELPAFA